MSSKKPLVLAGLVIIGFAVVAIFDHGPRPPAARPAPTGAVVAVESAPATVSTEAAIEKLDYASNHDFEAAPNDRPKDRPAIASPAALVSRPKQAAALDPMARVALSFVGVDADAEAYWISAINDPTLPPDERKDLIEDLNEDGLSDPHHPAPGDLPLILSRIQLIEELAPNSLDQVNADAFQEAYKDLVNLASGGTAQ